MAAILPGRDKRRVGHRRPREVVITDIPHEIDAATAPDFRAILHRIIESHRYSPPARLIIDLSEVSFMCSSGVQALLDAKRAARGLGIALWVRNPQPAPGRVLEITGLTDHLLEPL